jgi:hypothetical protein
MGDWERWGQFQAGISASRRGIRRSKDGVVGQALRIFRRAYARGEWGLPGCSYKAAANALTVAGYPTNDQGFKNTRRDKNPLPEHTIPADAPGVRELILALLSMWPEFKWKRLIDKAGPDYLRQTSNGPQLFGLEIGGKPSEFHTAV